VFFFFKQKTAYEMLDCDWSSDVCSSDLLNAQIAVEARNTVKAFGQGDATVRALNDVSVTIRKGEFFTLLGPSGCGKTTLLRLIAGFEMPTSGQILLDGQDITWLPPNKRPVNTVFQSYALFPHLTVAQNVAFGLQMQGKPAAEVKATTDRMLALVKLEAMAGRKTSQLSGGQQQRVALARALACEPRLLLLDEPFAALNPMLRQQLREELLATIRRWGIPAILITHDIEDVLALANRALLVEQGRVVREIDLDTPAQRELAPAQLSPQPQRAPRPGEDLLRRWLGAPRHG
jgi:spermidine/putrescine transport system ATP-binding protein